MGTVFANHARAHALSEGLVLVPLLLLSLVWQVGAHADAWYHAHYGIAIDSFVTSSHAMLYAGWAGTAVLALARLGRPEPLRGLHHSYRLVVAGVVIFGTGGLLDVAWHQAFGFEAGLGTLFSPSHLWLLVGSLVANVGMLHALVVTRTRKRQSRHAWLLDGALVLSLATLFRSALWTAFFAAPLAVDYASGGAAAHGLPSFAGVDWPNQAAQTAGTTGMLLYSVMLALFLTAAVRHFELPTGGVAGLVLWDGLLTVATTGMWIYLPAVALGALTGECWLAFARHRHPHDNLPELACWILAACVPVVQFGGYFGIMALLGGGITWPAHLWTGTIVSAGLFAAIASILAVPPAWAIHRYP